MTTNNNFVNSKAIENAIVRGSILKTQIKAYQDELQALNEIILKGAVIPEGKKSVVLTAPGDYTVRVTAREIVEYDTAKLDALRKIIGWRVFKKFFVFVYKLLDIKAFAAFLASEDCPEEAKRAYEEARSVTVRMAVTYEGPSAGNKKKAK